MRLLLWRCRELRYADAVRSDRPSGIAKVAGSRTAEAFSDVLAVFTCIESGDHTEQLAEATTAIVSVLKMLGGGRDVVIVPFAHLSSDLAPASHAVAMLNELRLRVNKHTKAYMTSFGYHKEFELYFRGAGHPGSVAYRSFP